MTESGGVDGAQLKCLLEEIIGDQQDINEKYNDLLRQSQVAQHQTKLILANQARVATQIDKLIGLEDSSLTTRVQTNNRTINRIHDRIDSLSLRTDDRIDSLSSEVSGLKTIIHGTIALILMAVVVALLSLVVKGTPDNIPLNPPDLPGKQS